MEENDSKEKIIHDEDLSNDENDSLLLDMNNNIEKNSHPDEPALNEASCCSITFEENEKCLSYNKDKEIISNYIKNFYNKYKRYPKTKMNFYKYGRLLGKGAFGKVNLSLHVLTGRLVAIKSINKLLFDEKQKEKIKLETSIMKLLSKSNNIVKIFETYETKKHYCIVMEHIGAGNLLSYVKKRVKLSEQIAKFIFKQIILSLQYIHSHNIVHRDIKLGNILIDLDNTIKLCDFTLSKIVKKGELLMEQLGTHSYIAPEVLLNKGYEGFGADIWSAGVVLYMMLGGKPPFKSDDINELHNLIIKGEFKPIENISSDATNLIRSILEVDPKKRIGIKDILVHPWLNNVDLNFWKSQNLFTNTEYIFLVKNNVDYRDINNKENMIENFDIKNLDTSDENENKNDESQSFIFTPFNTFIEGNNNNLNISDDDEIDLEYKNLEIENDIIEYTNKVKNLNRKYEMNNNEEIDNGIFGDKYYEQNNISPSNGNFNNSAEENNLNMDNNKENEINEKALEDLEELGFNKFFVKESLMKNDFNHATTSYGLIVKYCYS